jgi:hypothetical protein
VFTTMALKKADAINSTLAQWAKSLFALFMVGS